MKMVSNAILLYIYKSILLAFHNILQLFIFM